MQMTDASEVPYPSSYTHTRMLKYFHWLSRSLLLHMAGYQEKIIEHFEKWAPR